MKWDRSMAEDELANLLIAARTGQAAAMDRFVRLTQDRVWRYTLSQLRRPDAAADAVQETFARMLERLDRWHPGIDPLGWLLGFARNVVREARRRRRPPPDLGRRREAGLDPIAAVIHDEHKRRLWQAIDRLPPRQRQVVALRIFEQLSVDQTAEAMGCRPGTVKAMLFKAVRNLRRMMDDRQAT